MKTVSSKWFERPKRKPRIVKKLADKFNRNRAVLRWFLAVNWGIVKSEKHARRLKGAIARTGCAIQHKRRFLTILLKHKRLHYNASIISVADNGIRKLKIVNRNDVAYYRSIKNVVSVIHADGTKETF